VQRIPPNASFFVDDLEEPWDYSQKFDFVFARFLTGSIRDWPKFFNQSYKYKLSYLSLDIIESNAQQEP
jgi:hypothetical protein